jgi:hypothetical protein
MTQLCAIPGCRQRNRHLPTCTDDCLGCQPRLAEDGLCCDQHVRWAAESLAEIIALTDDARAVAAGLVRHGSGGGGKPGSRSPGNDDAMDVINAVSNALTTMARAIAEERGLQIPSAALGDVSPADPLTRAAKWLTGQLDWLRHATDEQGGPYAASVFAEIRDCASRMRAVVEGPADRRYLGPCGAPQWVENLGGEAGCRELEGPPCDGNVYARYGAPTGYCQTCGAQVNTDERRKWLDAEVRSRAFTAKDIADAYEINVKTIRSWATERQARYDHSGTVVQAARPAKLRTYWRTEAGLTVEWADLVIDPHLEGDELAERRAEVAAEIEARGDRLHYVGDVLDLAAVDAARREQARAERARRAAARTEGAAA